MPCHTALISNCLSANPESTVGEIIDLMKKKGAKICIVLDENKRMLGYFDFNVLLKNLLPVSLQMQGSTTNAGIVVGAAPGIAKRLKKVKPLAIHQIMERKFKKLSPNTPVWEGVQMLVEFGSPVFILEDGNDKFVGVMDDSSALEELERIQTEQGGQESHAVSE